MKRVTTFSLLIGLCASLGMSGQACDPAANLIFDDLRGDPIIIGSTPREGSFERSFEVDLRDYPDAASINWDFGDGGSMKNLSVSRGRRVAHGFQENGTFTVTVRLFSAPDIVNNTPGQLIGTGTLPVDVTGPNVEPVPAFTVENATNPEGVTGVTKKFSASRSRDPDGFIVEYRWDFGDGGQAIGQTVEHTYSQSGRYVVRLSTKDNHDARTFVERTIFVNSQPESRFRIEIDETNPLLVRFSGSRSNDADGEIVRYDWTFGDGETAIDGGIMVSHEYDAPGTYTAQLDVFDDQGATDLVRMDVTVSTDQVTLTSVTERYGVVDNNDFALGLEGLNFADGATVRLVRGSTGIDATSIDFESKTRLNASFDLTGAVLGDYDVVVTVANAGTDELDDAVRVVTENRVRLVTSLGDMVFELVDDAPVTTENFLQYVEDGFYDGTVFHRVVPDFVVQGGGFLPDGSQPDGLRDPIVNEFSPSRSNLRSTVAMAKLGGDPDSATSQFFVNLDDNSDNLDNQNGGFTVFARVVEGMDVADAIAAVDLDGEEPVVDVILERAERE